MPSPDIVAIAFLGGGTLLRLAAAHGAGSAMGPVVTTIRAVLLASGAACIAIGAGVVVPTLAVAMGAAVMAVATRFLRGRLPRAALDGAFMLALCLWPTPPAGASTTLACVAGYVAVGYLADRFLPPASLGGTWVRLAAGLVVAAAILFKSVPTASMRDVAAGTVRGELAIALPRPGTHVTLPSGSALWIDGRGSGDVVLFLHGADRRGAYQRAAHALQQAMRARGFAVASLDHPGFGASPTPSPAAAGDQWNPLPHVAEARAELESRFPGRGLILIGHSMGCTAALQSRDRLPGWRSLVLFGAGLPDGSERDQYWHERFLRNRGITESMSPADVKWVRDTYYDNGASARELQPGGAPIVFVAFGREHANIAARRDELYAMLPEPKSYVRVDYSDHYFDARDLRLGLVTLRLPVIEGLAADLGQWLDVDRSSSHSPR